jgi:hypothetical protein
MLPPYVALVAAAAASLLATACSGGPSPGHPAETIALTGAVNGCSVFPSDNYWHADISGLPVNPRNKAWRSHMSISRDLHPDFGPSYGDGPNYGIPVTVVDSSHDTVSVKFDYDDESDHVPYPLGDDTRIEGGSDRHAIVVDEDWCKLYETFATRDTSSGWKAGSGATWDLSSNALRPNTWTSADAAGLPILPGLLRWDEVHDGTLDHAVRFTTDVTSRWHVWPARHDAGSRTSHNYPPMGARFRLKKSFDASGYSTYAKTVISAFKKYGLVLADNGSPWYFQGEQNAAWPPDLVEELKSIPARAFVAVDTHPLQVDPNTAQVH